MKTVIFYSFGILTIAIYIFMAFISRTASKTRYQYRIILSFITIISGLLLDHIFVNSLPRGYFTLFGSAPLIYLLYYELIRRLMKPWIGPFPYAPQFNKIADKIKGDGYPNHRTVTRADFVYGIIMLALPIFTVAILSAIIG
jgi:hypothetical protein